MIRIAEAKKISPWNGVLSELPIKTLIRMAVDIGDWVSIHTEAPWGGSLDLIRMAADMTNKPILAKGIHLTDKAVLEARRAGATRVLVVGRVPELGQICLVEPNDLKQLEEFKDLGHGGIVWNRRDLTTGKPKTEMWKEARAINSGWMCCASLRQKFPKDAEACLFSVR